jgi:hypothetical protein
MKFCGEVMATKEDILEQIVEEYLIHKGYFVRHNIKFLPRKDHIEFVSNKDSNHSDIDVVGYHPHQRGANKVFAVSCKSWQGGFHPAHWLDAIEKQKKISGRDAWKSFRELVAPKWSEAFVDAVRAATGTDKFTYVIAVAHVVGDRTLWEQNTKFRKMIGNNPIRIITFEEMISEIDRELKDHVSSDRSGPDAPDVSGQRIRSPRKK